MFPVEVDGCSLVIIRDRARVFGGYEIIESGFLSFDGDALELQHQDGTRRPFTDGELGECMSVTAHNRIGECAGFQLFILKAS